MACALTIAEKRALATGSGFLSGWYTRASCLYAAFTSVMFELESMPRAS